MCAAREHIGIELRFERAALSYVAPQHRIDKPGERRLTERARRIDTGADHCVVGLAEHADLRAAQHEQGAHRARALRQRLVHQPIERGRQAQPPARGPEHACREQGAVARIGELRLRGRQGCAH